MMEDLIYGYLVKNCVGYDNRVKAKRLQQLFKIDDNKAFRDVIKRIRKDENYRYAVMSKSSFKGGYWIPTSREEIEIVSEDFKRRGKFIEDTGETIKNKEYYKG